MQLLVRNLLFGPEQQHCVGPPWLLFSGASCRACMQRRSWQLSLALLPADGVLLQVASMRKRYKRTAAAMQERNRLLKETAEVHAAYLRVPGAPFKQLADDDGSLTPEAQQQRQEWLDGWRAALQQQQQHQPSKQQQKHGNPPSPTLPGMHGAAPAGQEDDDEDDDGGGLFGDAPPRQQGNMGDFMDEDDD